MVIALGGEKVDNEKEIVESVKEDIFEENSGLEEKQDSAVDAISEKEISLPLGVALNNEGLYRLASKKKIDFICIMGPVGSGKTTFQAMLYGLFLREVNDNLIFSSSESLAGFEELLDYVRVDSGNTKVDMPRTPKQKGEKYYHLELLCCSTNQKKDVVLADIAGELFDICKANSQTLDKQVPYLGMAKNVAIFIDGKNLLDKAQFNVAIMNTRTMMLTIKSSEQFREKMNIDIIISKNDELVGADKDKLILKRIDTLKKQLDSLSEYFTIQYFRIQALNDYKQKDDSSTTILDLMIYWAKEEFNRKQIICQKNQLKATSCFNKFMERQSYE